MAKDQRKGLAAVTGSSRGIGKAIALDLAENGYDLILISRPSEMLSKTATEIAERTGRKVDIAHADLLDEAACVKAVQHGEVDVLVNCGIYQANSMNERIDSVTSEELRRTFQGNVLTQIALTKAVLPSMLNKKKGRIFQLVSSSSRVQPTRAIDKGGFQAFAYTASKTAIAKMVPLLALEFSEYKNIKFFNIDPGLVITDKMRNEGTASRFEKWGAVTPEHSAKLVTFLCDDTNLEKAQEFNGAEYVDAPKVAMQLNLISKL